MTVKITGYQWKWHYEYIGEEVGFYSSLAATSNAARRLDSGIDPFAVENYLLDVDRPLVIPAGVKVRYLITSNDVLHAWWVPDFAVKKDAIPGFINEGWFQVNSPGTYRGQCAELCGKDHGFMPVVVEVLPRDDFNAWLAAERASQAVARTGGGAASEAG
jgi:cytochrome c oxidase subunit 2